MSPHLAVFPEAKKLWESGADYNLLKIVPYRGSSGEFPQYYVRDHHEAIIDRETFAQAQDEIERRSLAAPNRSKAGHYPFTGKIVCGNCGCHYKRKITNGKVAWNCMTFLQNGKAFCHAKQIPEDVLYELASETLELDTFDEETFHHRIREIRVPAFNHVVFVFHDGREVERVWKDRSRAESWTAEMRAQAANNTRKTMCAQDACAANNARRGTK